MHSPFYFQEVLIIHRISHLKSFPKQLLACLNIILIFSKTLIGFVYIVLLIVQSNAFAQNKTSLVISKEKGGFIVKSDIQKNDTHTGIFTGIGNVHFLYRDRGISGTSSQIQYFNNERIIVLTGNVDILRNNDSFLRADRIVFMINEDKFVADSAPGSQVLGNFIFKEPEPNQRKLLP